VYEYENEVEAEYSKIKHVPEDKIVARFDGSWRGKITWTKTRGADTVSHVLARSNATSQGQHAQSPKTLIDVSHLAVLPKTVRPLHAQGPYESRRFWRPVTEAIKGKEYSKATKAKQAIEQAQREIASARAKKGEQ
jgi:oxysterol-binding protein-related protein 9/10/11